MEDYNEALADNAPAGWKRKAALFLSSQALSLAGSMLVQYAIIWHITLTTGSGAVLTAATIAAFLPQVLISVFAGVWADRYSRKALIVCSDALTAASTLALAAFFLAGYRELWLIYLVTGIRSLGAGIQTPAVGALLPQIVPAEKLMKVNGINATLQPFIMIVTPVVAGAILTFSRIEEIFFIDVFTAAIAIGLLSVMKVPAFRTARDRRTTGYFDDLKEGTGYAVKNRQVRSLFVFFGLIWFLVVPVAFLSPLLVARSFGDEVWKLTANEVTFFAGSILGGIAMTLWGGFGNRFRTIGLSCLVWAALFTGLGLARSFALYLVFMFLSGIPMPFLNASTMTLLQEIVEPDMQGRVFGLQQLISMTVMPIGMLVFGPVADLITIEALLVIASPLMAAPGLWLMTGRHAGGLRLRRTRTARLELRTGE
jgi:DHA3 family macrolide efflux protein-like MFS transporter